MLWSNKHFVADTKLLFYIWLYIKNLLRENEKKNYLHFVIVADVAC